MIDLENHTVRDREAIHGLKGYHLPTYLITSAQGDPGLTNCEDLAMAFPINSDSNIVNYKLYAIRIGIANALEFISIL